MFDQDCSENDYELLYMIYQMDELSLQTLVKKYELMCEVVIHNFITSAEEYQFEELMLGCVEQLYHAIYCFRMDQNTNFATFFKQVLKYYLTNFYRKWHTFRGKCMRHQVSLDAYVRDFDCTLMDMIPNSDLTLEGIYVLNQEGMKHNLKRLYKHLMPWEQEVLELRIKGYSYQEIAKKLDVETRQVEYVLIKLKKWKSFH